MTSGSWSPVTFIEILKKSNLINFSYILQTNVNIHNAVSIPIKTKNKFIYMIYVLHF